MSEIDNLFNEKIEQENLALYEDMKALMLKKLEGFDWLKNLRLKCRAYIKTNGVKTTTVEEILDFLKEEAMKTFPINIKEELDNEFVNRLNVMIGDRVLEQLYGFDNEQLNEE